ncbi:MAG: SufE family protein [Gemmatimonadetes bacterium]|nr:SufE family protein [Gemmatimonadota bacterium]NNK48445.1 SufE family protein [Gemmatimonadota bacterium]
MPMPDKLQGIVDQFAAAPKELRVHALLDYSRRVPPLPEELAGDRKRLEQVHECQTPFFLATEIDDTGAVHLFFDCPPEAPTVRGFAGILREGLEGEPWRDVIEVPPNFYSGMGLQEVVSALRLRGMGAILARLKRQIRETVNGGEDL